MKIVYLVANIRTCGPLRVIDTIIDNIDSQQIYMISIFGNKNNNNLIKKYEEKSIKVINLKLTKTGYILHGKRKLQDILNRINPDVVHSHGIQADCLLSKIKKYYKVTTIHCNLYEDYEYKFGKIKSRFIVKEHIKNLNKIDKKICCSKSIYEKLIKDIKDAEFIRNGIELIETNYEEKQKYKRIISKKLDLSNNSIIYIFCGSISKRKSVVELIELFNNNHKDNEYLLILGAGTELEKCKKIASNNVKILGRITNVYDYYKASDIYISNSTSEGFSISVLEALSTHNLLLLSDIPSHNECINLSEDIYVGEIFNKNNFNNQKQKLNGKKFNNKILEIISAKKMGELYLKIYKGEKI